MPELTLTQGTKLGPYQILSWIGAGGMGEVYRAHDPRLGRDVAIKVLPRLFAADPGRLRLFEQEARATAALNHPNICTIYDVDQSVGQPFIVMEFIEGQMLRDLIARQRQNVERVVEFGIQIADALEAAHSKGIVHRDIKPSNIFVGQRGHIKILDFGLAKLSPLLVSQTAQPPPSTLTTSTLPNATIGTPGYMSPEQARGEDVDSRSDLFSLGAVLYEMCTGKPAFAGHTTAVVFDAILNRDPISPVLINRRIPPKLSEIIGKALEKDREIRYQHAAEIRADLKRLKRDSESTIPLNPAAIASSRRPRVSSRKELPRIAVLPFENSSNNPETEFLSDGITESLISSLSQLSNLRVISRTSVFRYKGLAIEPQTIGRELNVGAILAGRMVSRDDSVSISLELIDARDNSLIWGARFESRMANLMALEEEIAQRIAEHLPLEGSSPTKKHLPRRPTENPEAFQLCLKGRYCWNKRTNENLKRGLQYFNLAIEKDPACALAYAGVADSYTMLVWNMMSSPHDGLPKARIAASNALEIDNRLAEAHSPLAFVKLFYDWDWPGAEQEFRRTIELNPNYAMAWQWYAMELAALGRHEEAVRETEKALQLDPLSMSINATTGLLFYLVRQYDYALEQIERTLELDSSFFPAHFICGCVHEQLKRHDEAVKEFQAAVDLSGRLPLFLGALGHGWVTSGNLAEANKILEELLATPKGKYRSSYCVAEIYVALGEVDRALEWLEKAYEERGTWMIFLKVHPLFDPIRVEPRFQEILRRMGLPDNEATISEGREAG